MMELLKNVKIWIFLAISVAVLVALWLGKDWILSPSLMSLETGGIVLLVIGAIVVVLLTALSWKGDFRGNLEQKYRSPKARFATFVLIVVFIPSTIIYSQSIGDEGVNGAIPVIQYLFAVVTLAFIWLFTQPLPVVENRLPDDAEPEAASGDAAGTGEETAQRKFARLKIYWMFFSYSFMVLALVAAVYPFMTDLKPEPGHKDYKNNVHRTTDSPIGVFRGCTSDAYAATTPVSCEQASKPVPEGGETSGGAERPRLSWILQVGGYVEPVAPKMLDAVGTAADVAPSDLEKQLLELARDSFLRGDAGYRVTGGLVIPFYLVVLALVGGAISLTRRIPEYQRQAAPGYVGDPDHPALTPALLRDLLVFQIIQFLTAPFLASVAYLVIGPSTTAGTVGLAFASGFASETVLLWVRSATDKLMPETAKQQIEAKGTIAGTLELDGKLPETAKSLEQAVTISIVGRTDVIAEFFDQGRFALSAVPAGQRVLEVKCKTGDTNALQVVNIQGNGTHMVQMQLGCGSSDPAPVQGEEPPAD